jgi:hypothetical protein
LLKKVYTVMAWVEGEEVCSTQYNDEIPWTTVSSQAVRILMDEYIREGIVDTEGDFELISIHSYWTLFGKKITPYKEVFYFDAFPDQD